MTKKSLKSIDISPKWDYTIIKIVPNGTNVEVYMESKSKQIEQFHTQIKEFIGLYRETAAKHSISENEFWVWQTLILENGEHTQQELCSTWSLPKQTVNAIIAHMIRKKYARLERKPRQKAKIICLTEEGRKYGEMLVSSIIEAENKAFMQISPEDFGNLIRIIQQYTGLVRYELENATRA